jgi:hypothetical protein
VVLRLPPGQPIQHEVRSVSFTLPLPQGRVLRRGDVSQSALQAPGAVPGGFENDRNTQKVGGPFPIEKLMVLHK